MGLLGPTELYNQTPSATILNPTKTLKTSSNPDVHSDDQLGLLGPPELYNQTPTPQPEPKAGDPFMDLMVSDYNKAYHQTPPRGYTENLSPTFLSSGNPCLDFFFHVVPNTPPETLKQRLELAWAHNPLTTLKLICNLRGVRGTGKSDKEGFYTAALFLHMNHPKTLVHNLESFANFGYFKDLPEILYRLLQGPDIRKKQKDEHDCNKKYSVKPIFVAKEITQGLRGRKRLAMANNALERYNRDMGFRSLHNSVSDLFAKYLKADMEFLNSGQLNKISLAAKWCPSIDCSFDRSLLLCESIARRKYLEDVKCGKSTISAGALLPHEIIESAIEGTEAEAEVADLQWKRMVEDLLKEGKLRNCFAVCDVSGSMWGTPFNVSVALGLLVSELSEEPWKGKVITFSEKPQLHIIKGDDLKSKMRFSQEVNFMNTDFQKVFDHILQVAVDGNLKEDQMIKRVFAFSDMEFDQASKSDWETDYEVIQRKFREKGYGSVVPEIVFWNLRNSQSTPVVSMQKGVAMVSGFSKNMMKLFLNNDGEILNTEFIMEMAISGEEAAAPAQRQRFMFCYKA
ncbi:uncharacterized protein CFP56_016503 [Quercus suber]|uniref:DUF2828 domain-containing protein n=1 Tax=Quercus suber TaxID=58331 RepID=A0AAW0M0X4_QUESU